MITPDQLADALKRNNAILKMQARGLTTEQSLTQLPFRANCLNWVLGHILTNRRAMLYILTGQNPAWSGQIARYERESEPISGREDGVLELPTLLELLATSHKQIAGLLQAITPEQIAEPVAFLDSRDRSRAEWLMFFYFHDCYHTGQSEILRQAAGTDDKII